MNFPVAQTSRVSSGTYETYPSFFIAVTNNPDIIAQARQNPQLNQEWQRQTYPGAMFIPGAQIHFGPSYAEIYEQLLYNTLRYQLREAIRAYLQRTRRVYPVIFVFDLSTIFNTPFQADLKMEFDLLDLNQIIMNLSNEQMMSDAQHANTSRASTTDQSVQVDLDKQEQQQQQQQPSVQTTLIGDQRYCLIIFNNPSWSARLRKRPQQTEQHPSNIEKQEVVKSEPTDNVSTDNLFIAQLRQLIRDYMQRTTRPFPLKYFLDFTEH